MRSGSATPSSLFRKAYLSFQLMHVDSILFINGSPLRSSLLNIIRVEGNKRQIARELRVQRRYRFKRNLFSSTALLALTAALYLTLLGNFLSIPHLNSHLRLLRSPDFRYLVSSFQPRFPSWSIDKQRPVIGKSSQHLVQP